MKLRCKVFGFVLSMYKQWREQNRLLELGKEWVAIALGGSSELGDKEIVILVELSWERWEWLNTGSGITAMVWLVWDNYGKCEFCLGIFLVTGSSSSYKSVSFNIQFCLNYVLTLFFIGFSYFFKKDETD